MSSPAFDVDWVFGYGSLIWNPEIEYEQASLARLHGWHRSFCVSSTRYRGTADEPGVVLGLDRGGSCVGIAYRLRDESREDAIRHLYEREIPDWETRVYRAFVTEVRLGTGTSVQALTFAADRARPSYARLSDDEILRRLQMCRGRRGANREYAINTWQALEARGVRDARLARLVRRLLRESAASPAGPPIASLSDEAATLGV
ncbi:MAG: gamma-glutamylcyclotransferase [Burkholderiaceae bacterium]|nr:gamma-glutamylcyclotransferase [Burkholderiaceae bacterium]